MHCIGRVERNERVLLACWEEPRHEMARCAHIYVAGRSEGETLAYLKARYARLVGMEAGEEFVEKEVPNEWVR